MKDKEDKTELHSGEAVKKDHPQICFRGMIDALYGQLLWAGILAEKENHAAQKELQSLMDCCREVSRAEVTQTPIKPIKIMGLEQEEVRRLSHCPQALGGYHFFPEIADGELIAAVNLARISARNAERAAVTAYGAERPDLVALLNRISSAAYIIMCRIKFCKNEAGREEIKE
ncbi:MAG: hypothetical protein ACYCX2_08170 [Christensenellales bacterium]